MRNIPYGKIIIYLVVIIAMAALGGYVWAKGHHAYLVVCVPIVVIAIFRLFKL